MCSLVTAVNASNYQQKKKVQIDMGAHTTTTTTTTVLLYWATLGPSNHQTVRALFIHLFFLFVDAVKRERSLPIGFFVFFFVLYCVCVYCSVFMCVVRRIVIFFLSLFFSSFWFFSLSFLFLFENI